MSTNRWTRRGVVTLCSQSRAVDAYSQLWFRSFAVVDRRFVSWSTDRVISVLSAQRYPVRGSADSGGTCRNPVPPCVLPGPVCPAAAAGAASAGDDGGPQVAQVRAVRARLRQPAVAADTRGPASRSLPLPLLVLRQGLLVEHQPERARGRAHGRAPVRVPVLRAGLALRQQPAQPCAHEAPTAERGGGGSGGSGGGSGSGGAGDSSVGSRCAWPGPALRSPV